MAGPYSPDFSILGDLGKTYKAAQMQAGRERSLAALGQGASIEDVSRSLFQAGDVEGGLSLAKLADAQAMRKLAQSNADRSHNLEVQKFHAEQSKPRIVGSAETGYFMVDAQGRPMNPGGAPSTTQSAPSEQPTGPQPVIPAKPKAPKELTATDRKAIQDAEDDNVNLQGTVSALKRALELNPLTFTGYTADIRGAVGSKMPFNVPGIDRGSAEATSEWQKLMSGEAIRTMASTLKGATTDFELRKFEQMLADPSTPANVREGIIKRMLMLAERKTATNQGRMDQLRGGTYYKPGGGASSETQGAGVLDEARSAIAKGAPRDAVIKRLREKGIDPAGL